MTDKIIDPEEVLKKRRDYYKNYKTKKNMLLVEKVNRLAVHLTGISTDEYNGDISIGNSKLKCQMLEWLIELDERH